MSEKTAKKILLHIFLISVVVVVLFWGNTLSRQRAQFSRGEQAMERGDTIAAVSAYASAIHMYTPGSSLVEKSARRLWSLGEDLERKGDKEKALIAYRSLRSACYAIRGLTSPGAKWITRCDAKIAGLTTGPANRETPDKTPRKNNNAS